MKSAPLFRLCLQTVGMSQADFAASIAVAPSTLSQVLNGKRTSARVSGLIEDFVAEYSGVLAEAVETAQAHSTMRAA